MLAFAVSTSYISMMIYNFLPEIAAVVQVALCFFLLCLLGRRPIFCAGECRRLYPKAFQKEHAAVCGSNKLWNCCICMTVYNCLWMRKQPFFVKSVGSLPEMLCILVAVCAGTAVKLVKAVVHAAKFHTDYIFAHLGCPAAGATIAPLAKSLSNFQGLGAEGGVAGGLTICQAGSLVWNRGIFMNFHKPA